ncbi:hypothetical protein SKAU_G00339650 [Synaphobranchus kaupii]|uniref:Uncharacterized protein n=1 Tax=Synaphobranchus kaupii TaxID=118154 RepID=A0A9Q1EMQ4_SYNKA|nr:hypothetical protein SKAU_G00339650 [Synaphobranchus kaupii]
MIRIFPDFSVQVTAAAGGGAGGMPAGPAVGRVPGTTNEEINFQTALNRNLRSSHAVSRISSPARHPKVEASGGPELNLGRTSVGEGTEGLRAGPGLVCGAAC